MGVVHYCDNDASCKDSTSNAHLVGLMEGCSAGAEGDIEDNGAEEGGWHSPGPIPSPSQSPMVLSEHSSDFDLESEGADLGADKPLEGWKDWEALVKALPKLVEKACDLQMDLLATGLNPLCSSHGDDWSAEPLLRSEAEIQLDRHISNHCKD